MNRGALFEGDIFSILYQSPYIIRSFEFANADGALDCTHAFDNHLHTSYAERLWRVDQRRRDPDPSEFPSELLLFDVKSTVSAVAGHQIYATSLRQRRNVAFYICICASAPNFVELIPNRYQNVITPEDQDNRMVAVNTPRTSRLPFSVYKLDPSGSPYRLPLAMLGEAVSRIRLCAQGKGCYVNPWTHVAFEDWQPTVTTSTESIQPAIHTMHYSAYLAAMAIYRQIANHNLRSELSFDFVGLQPRLADFKLILNTLPPKQYFVQHKLDSRDRALSTPLTKVFVGRNKDHGRVDWFFTPDQRFDFLFYEFQFSTGTREPRRKECFFLPESVLPNSFYTTESLEASFEIPGFSNYRIHMDRDGEWIYKIHDIIKQHPHPNRSATRPRRTAEESSFRQEVKDVGILEETEHPRPQEPLKSHGTQDYAAIMTLRHRRFFHGIMAQCAQRGSGMLVLLGDHPEGDFGFCRYRWSEEERQAYLHDGRLPVALDGLSASVPMVPLYYYTRAVEMTFLGPQMLSSEFRRLRSSVNGRLIFYDVFGNDDHTDTTPLIVIPSNDIGLTHSQAEPLIRNLNTNKHDAFVERTPLLAHTLLTGHVLSDYSLSDGGPDAFCNTPWDSAWEILNAFSRAQPMFHPKNHLRYPQQYRQSLSDLNTRLSKEHDCSLDNLATH